MAQSKDNNFGGLCVRRSNFTQASFFGDIDPGISVRPPMHRDIYDNYRPNEQVPSAVTQEDYRKIMIMCKNAYERVGVIRSVIDMMSEFGAEGVQIIHEDAGPNAFYKNWSRKVRLEDRVERFLSWFYKTGNVVIRRTYGQLKQSDLKRIQESMPSTNAGSGRGRIPLEYIFYDPATIELVGGQAGALSQNKIYAVRIPFNFLDGSKNPKNELEREVFEKLPQEIKDALAGKSDPRGVMLLPIPSDKIHVAFYKKDDNDIWAKSFIYSILEDVIYNDKLKLAKTSGLDSWYNAIRIWTVGDHRSTPPRIPDPTQFAKLASILESNTGGGTADVIWDSAIDLKEFYPPIEKLANFQENLHNILLGLGVPESLVGGSSKNSSAMSNNYLGLKNLIKRLEAGRRAVTEWLESEIDIIQREMGFRKRPVIRFAHTDLHDERTYFNLLVQLLDRNVISDYTVLERINEIPEIERSRLSTETSLRENGSYPLKATPFHSPDLKSQQLHEIRKLKLQQNNADSSGLNSSNILNRVIKKRGRPFNSPDTVRRRRSPNKMRSSVAKLMVEAARIYDTVDEFTKKLSLNIYGVENIRQLTSAQLEELDAVRLDTFVHCAPFNSLTEENIITAMNVQDGPINEFREKYQGYLNDLGSENVSNDQKRLLRIQAYVDAWLELES